MNGEHATSGSSGTGLMQTADHRIDGLEYVITKVGQFQQSEVGVVILAPDDARALRRMHTESAHLELADSRRLAITLYDLPFVSCGSLPDEPQYLCFEVVE